MIGGNKKAKSKEIDTIIGKETSFDGKIISRGNLRIDGMVNGTVEAYGDLVIGKEAKVVAEIQSENVLIAGEIKGNVVAAGRVELAATAKVEGDLHVGSLIVEDGAIIQGKCNIVKANEKMID